MVELTMGDFGDYLLALGPLWWGIVSAGGLFGLDEFLGRIAPNAKTWLDRKLAPHYRRKIEYGLLVVAVFAAGFFTWQGEHRELSKARHEQGVDTPRTLSGPERQFLLAHADDFRKLQYPLNITIGVGPDTLDYAWEFYEFFKSIGVEAYWPQPLACRAAERGILVGLKNPEAPSPEATMFIDLLRRAGMIVNTTKWFMTVYPESLDFDLFICPPRKR